MPDASASGLSTTSGSASASLVRRISASGLVLSSGQATVSAGLPVLRSGDTRIRLNFFQASLSATALAAAEILQAPEFVDLPVIGPDTYMPLTLNPLGNPEVPAEAPEIIWVVSHALNSDLVGVLRGQEDTVAREHPATTLAAHTITTFDAGSTKVVRTGPLGAHAALQPTYSWWAVPQICRRGLVSFFSIVPSMPAPNQYDLQVRSGPGSGGVFLEASNADGRYEITMPWYVEGDIDSTIWVGIRNKLAEPRAFTLEYLRVERFA